MTNLYFLILRIKIRIVIDFNATVLLRFVLIINRRVNFDFRGILQKEFEVLPELVLVPNALRHDVRHLVQRNEHERVGINELGPRLRGVQAERQLFTLVLTVSGQFARGQRFTHLLRVKSGN